MGPFTLSQRLRAVVAAKRVSRSSASHALRSSGNVTSAVHLLVAAFAALHTALMYCKMGAVPARHVGDLCRAINVCSERPLALGRMVTAASRSTFLSSASDKPWTSEPYVIEAIVPVVKTFRPWVPTAAATLLSFFLRTKPCLSLAAAFLPLPCFLLALPAA